MYASYDRAKAGRPARTYIQQLCEDTGCSPEDLTEAMNDREERRERVRDIGAGGTTWWWWWWQLLGNIVSGYHQTTGDERKNLKIISQENEKTTRNQTFWKKSHQWNKLLGYSLREIWTILEVDEGRIWTNGPENKKTHGDAYGVTSHKW